MKKNKTFIMKSIAIMVITAMLLCVVSCTKTEKSKDSVSEQPSQDITEGTVSSENDVNESKPVYPIEGSVTLTMNLDSIDRSEIPKYVLDSGAFFWDVVEEKTGVKLEFIGGQSNAMNASEQFILLLASGDYPDIFVSNWIEFPGGPATAIAEKYIITLDGYEQYYPNLLKRLGEEDERINKDVRTDDGKLYGFPFVCDPWGTTYAGPVVRKDWLDKLGLDEPVTVDDWYEMLTLFRDEIGAPSPLVFMSAWLFTEYNTSYLSNAWGVAYPFYVDGKEIKFGPCEPGYYDFLIEMNKWFKEGLIDKEMPSIDKGTTVAKFANGEAGVMFRQTADVISVLNANKDNPEFKVAPLKAMVLNEGDERKFCHATHRHKGSFMHSISTTCKNVEAALRFCDYFYGDEGHMLASYGTEGISYKVVDGEILYTDWIVNNPENLNPHTAIGFFAKRTNFAAFNVKPPHNFQDPVVFELVDVWRDSNMDEYIVPQIAQSIEESNTIASKYTDIDTYCREMIVNFIIGAKPLSEYETFIKKVKDYGIDTVLEIKNQACQRYLAR